MGLADALVGEEHVVVRSTADVGKGRANCIAIPLAHVGRGAHNDVRLTDESVSETHAKLQRRDDGWYAVDMNSTNGTYVGGSRVKGERRLDGTPDVRFGGVKMRFTAADLGASELDGARSITAPERQRTLPKAMPPIPSTATAPPQSSGRGMVWLVLTLVVVAAAVFFVLRGRV